MLSYSTCWARTSSSAKHTVYTSEHCAHLQIGRGLHLIKANFALRGSYEREAIEAWLTTHDTSPRTGYANEARHTYATKRVDISSRMTGWGGVGWLRWQLKSSLWCCGALRSLGALVGVSRQRASRFTLAFSSFFGQSHSHTRCTDAKIFPVSPLTSSLASLPRHPTSLCLSLGSPPG